MVVGSGGREHAICWALLWSRRVSRLICAPGNAGVAGIAECVAVGVDDISGLADLAQKEKIDLTFVGGETPLARGIVDEFQGRGLSIIGADQAAARLESSKAFAKEFMLRHGVPTARYSTAFSAADAVEILESGFFGGRNTPVVVKADGLAAGKGVVVSVDRAEALDAVAGLESIAGHDAASRIVLEECLTGREVSLLMFADGDDFALMPPAQDHKRIGDGDTGPNTGGMGAFTDDTLLTQDQLDQIVREIIKPTLKGCRSEGFPFRGILFLGLMMTKDGPRVLEYNVRFGDPETQAILVRLNTDLVDICEAMLNGKLDRTKIDWLPGSSACVVLVAEGYPARPRTGDVIHGLTEAAEIPNVQIFHAGTRVNTAGTTDSGELITSGGRVLGVTATGENLESALSTAYSAVDIIRWEGMQCRRDIGRSGGQFLDKGAAT